MKQFIYTTSILCGLTLTASLAGGQTNPVTTLNRGLAFGAVDATQLSVTVPGTSADSRSAWLTLDLGLGKTNCIGRINISVPSTISRTGSPSGLTAATTPYVATLINPDLTTTTVTIGSNFDTRFWGTHQLYIGTTGAFRYRRAGSYTGNLTVTFTKRTGC